MVRVSLEDLCIPNNFAGLAFSCQSDKPFYTVQRIGAITPAPSWYDVLGYPQYVSHIVGGGQHTVPQDTLPIPWQLPRALGHLVRQSKRPGKYSQCIRSF